MYKRQRVLEEDLSPSIESVHNRFDLCIRNIETGEETTAYAENVVTNAAWSEYIFRRSATVLRLGSSTEPEAPTQTNILSVVAAGINPRKTTYEAFGPNGNKRITEYFIGVNDYNNKVIAEMGLVNGSGYGNVFNRAILKDVNGNPITVNKTDLIEITFYVTVYVTANLQPWQALVNPTQALFSLIENGNQGFQAWTLTGGSKNVGGTYTLSPGKLEIKSVRQRPEELNKGICTIESFGISQDMFRSPKTYPVKEQALATGDGVKTDFYCGFVMRSINLYKNGVLVPQSEYTFNPNAGRLLSYGNDCGGVPVYSAAYRAVDPSTNKKVTNASDGGPVSLRPNATLIVEVPDSLIYGVGGTAYRNDFGWTGFTMYGSNDMVSWESIRYFNYPNTNQVFKGTTPFKYVKIVTSGPAMSIDWEVFCQGTPQIRFKTPPAVGDVLTFSGITTCIPKDQNHVMEMQTSLTYVDPTV